MKKSTLALFLACTMLLSVALSGCSSESSSTSSSSSNSSSTSSDVGADGRDADGNIVDLTAYSIYLGEQWFTEEDLEIWANIEEPSDNPDKIVWRASATNRSFDESPATRASKRFFIEMKKALGDRIEFQFYLNGALGTTTDQILGGLQAQSFESITYNVGAFYEYTRAFTPLDVGFLIPSTEAGIAVCDHDSPVRELMVARCAEETGLYLLMMDAVGMRQITSNKAISNLEELSGQKIRVQSNNLHMALFDALGTSPTPIAFAELFTALQQNTVDGQENPISNILEQNYAEVQTYMTLSNHLYTAGAFAVNQDWYLSLPEDVREAAEAASRLAQDQSGNDLLACESEMLEYLSSRMEIQELSEADQAEFKDLAMSMWSMAGEVMGDDYWTEIQIAVDEVISTL